MEVEYPRPWVVFEAEEKLPGSSRYVMKVRVLDAEGNIVLRLARKDAELAAFIVESVNRASRN